MNESVICVTIQKSPSRLSKLLSKSENKHSRDFVQIEDEELTGPVHQRENAFNVTNIKHSLWWFVLMASLVEVNFIWIFRVLGTHIKYKQTAIAQFVLVSGIRCSFSKRNVVRASANVMLLKSWKIQNNSTCLSKTFLNVKRSCFKDWSSLPKRTPQWSWKIGGLDRFPN